MSSLADLAITFARLSLLAIGGATAVLGEIRNHFVGNGTLTDADLGTLFAVAQAAPGPNVILVGLIGFRAAGWLGALVSTAAMCAPSGALAVGCSRVLERLRRTSWRGRLQRGFAPVTAGLLLGSGLSVERMYLAVPSLAVIGAAAAVLGLWRRVNPLLILAGAGALGAATAIWI